MQEPILKKSARPSTYEERLYLAVSRGGNYLERRDVRGPYFKRGHREKARERCVDGAAIYEEGDGERCTRGGKPRHAI